MCLLDMKFWKENNYINSKNNHANLLIPLREAPFIATLKDHLPFTQEAWLRNTHTVVENEAARGGAALASCAHAGEEGSPHYHLWVGVLVHNDGIIATQLKQVTTKAFLYHERNLHQH